MIEPYEHDLNKYLAKQDENAELLEEFNELIAPHLKIVEKEIAHIRSFAESYETLELYDEICDAVLEFLPCSRSK